MEILGQLGVALSLGMGAMGSAMGVLAAGKAAAGAWAKEGKAGKRLSFTYIILAAMPLSQTLYGMIVMNWLSQVRTNSPEIFAANGALILGIGLACGIGEMVSAWVQGIIGAAGIRCLSESEGKGFAFLVICMGLAETVGILSFVLLSPVIPK